MLDLHLYIPWINTAYKRCKKGTDMYGVRLPHIFEIPSISI